MIEFLRRALVQVHVNISAKCKIDVEVQNP